MYLPDYLSVLIKLGTTAIGVRSSEGVVLAVEKRVTSPLLVGTFPCSRSYTIEKPCLAVKFFSDIAYDASVQRHRAGRL